MQLVAAPLWGHWSDAVGRKRLVAVGIGGTALGQVLFGLAPTLAALYGARIVGGLLSAAILPAATAYVADITTPAGGAAGWRGWALRSVWGDAGLALGVCCERLPLADRQHLEVMHSPSVSGVAGLAPLASLPHFTVSGVRPEPFGRAAGDHGAFRRAAHRDSACSSGGASVSSA
jgi:MFS family permease